MSSARLLAALALCLGSTNTLPACPSYYVIVFAYQNCPNRPKDTHTWATFFKFTPEGETEDGKPALDYVSISWMPETLEVVIRKRRPELGKNLTLAESLDLAERLGFRVSFWGPYQIKPELYDRAVKQADRLASGKVLYKAYDAAYRTSKASNCTHAVSDLVFRAARLRVGTYAYGESASYRVLLWIRGFLIDPQVTHDWLLEALGIQERPMLKRSIRELKAWFPNH